MADPAFRKLLVIRFGAMGDLLHVSPALAAMKTASPSTEIHVLTAPLYEPLVSGLSGVSQVWTWDKATGWPGLWALAVQLRPERFDGLVNLHPSLRTWLFSRLVGARRQVVYHKEKLAVRGQAQRALSRLHATSDLARPFQQLFPSMGELLPPQLSVTGQPGPNRRIGLIPGVGRHRSNRAWPETFWKELIPALLAVDATVEIVLLGGPEEVALTERLLKQCPESDQPRLSVACGSQSIEATACLMAGCDLLIGGDTGPLHLAAAVGVPVVGLFGPTNSQRTGPQGKNPLNTVLTPPDELACWPCEQPTCPLSGEEELACMRSIPVEWVVAACRRILDAAKPKAPAP